MLRPGGQTLWINTATAIQTGLHNAKPTTMPLKAEYEWSRQDGVLVMESSEKDTDIAGPLWPT